MHNLPYSQQPRIEPIHKLTYNQVTIGLDSYTILIKPDDNGTYVAYIPAIPGCRAIDRTAAEAQSALADVFDMIAEEYAEENRQLPPDVPLKVAGPSAFSLQSSVFSL